MIVEIMFQYNYGLDHDFHYYFKTHFVNNLFDSQYYTEDSFNDMIGTSMPDPSLLYLFYLNIRSLLAQIKHLENCLSI